MRRHCGATHPHDDLQAGSNFSRHPRRTAKTAACRRHTRGVIATRERRGRESKFARLRPRPPTWMFTFTQSPPPSARRVNLSHRAIHSRLTRSPLAISVRVETPTDG